MREVGRDGDGGRWSKGTPAPLACAPAVLAVSSLAAPILDEESAQPRARARAARAHPHMVRARTGCPCARTRFARARAPQTQEHQLHWYPAKAGAVLRG